MVLDVRGNRYELGQPVQLPVPWHAGEKLGEEEGKSEPYLRELFGMEKSANKRFDALMPLSPPLRVEVKDIFPRLYSQARGGAECRRASGEVLGEVATFMKVAISHYGDRFGDERIHAFKCFLNELHCGSFSARRLEEFISVIDMLQYDNWHSRSAFIDRLGQAMSAFYPDPTVAFRSMLNTLTGPRVFDVDLMMVVFARKQLVILSPEMFNLLEPKRISQNVVSYGLGEELQQRFRSLG